MRNNSRHTDVQDEALDRALAARVFAATRPAEPNVSWDAFWADVSAAGDHATATPRLAFETSRAGNGRRRIFKGLTYAISGLAAAAALFLAISPGRDNQVAQPVDVAKGRPTPDATAIVETEDESAQEVSVDNGPVVILRRDKLGRIRPEGSGWEPSLAIGGSAYGVGPSDDTLEYIGDLEALGMDSLALSERNSPSVPSTTP